MAVVKSEAELSAQRFSIIESRPSRNKAISIPPNRGQINAQQLGTTGNPLRHNWRDFQFRTKQKLFDVSSSLDRDCFQICNFLERDPNNACSGEKDYYI